MIEGLLTMARKLLGLFIDDGSLAVSILVWIFVLHVVAPIVFVDHAWAAPVLFLGCVGVLVENVLRSARRPLPSTAADEHIGLSKIRS